MHHQISDIEGEVVANLAINFKAGLFRIGNLAVVAVHAPRAHGASWRTVADEIFIRISSSGKYAFCHFNGRIKAKRWSWRRPKYRN